MKTNRHTHLLATALAVAWVASPLAAVEQVRDHAGFVYLDIPTAYIEEVWTDMRPLALREAVLKKQRWPITVEGHGKGEILLEQDPHGRIAFLGVTENLKDAKLKVEMERVEASQERRAPGKCMVWIIITVPDGDGGTRKIQICIYPLSVTVSEG